MSLLAMSFGESEQKGRERGRWMGSSSGEKGMPMSGLSCRKALFDTGRAIFVLLSINGLRIKLSHLWGLHFQRSRVVF